MLEKLSETDRINTEYFDKLLYKLKRQINFHTASVLLELRLCTAQQFQNKLISITKHAETNT